MLFTHSLRRTVVLVLSLASLLPVARGGGLTIVTHGFNGNVVDWVIPMAASMAGYQGLPAGESSCYTLIVTSDPSAPAVWEGGKKPDLSPTGEVFIKLDWSAVAGLFGGRDSPEVAAIAVDSLLDASLIPETGGRPLVELPIHLVGHSRGASVVSEMARELGERGIWVDQLTLLDPQPTFGDAPVAVRTNVLFADNYWQNNVFPDGEFVPGAYNRYLTSFDGGYSSPHSDVHLWYFGTIDLATPSIAPEVTIDEAMRDTWWTPAEARGAATGYLYSRYGGGDRLSTAQPAGTERVVDGYNQVWDLGAGLASNRTALATNTGAWPNVILCRRDGSGPVAGGEPVRMALHYQAGPVPSGTVGATVLFDPDTNPWNGNETVRPAGDLPNSGTAEVFTATLDVDSVPVAPGTYFLAVRLEDGANARTLYARESLEVLPALPPEIDVATMRFEGGALRFTVRGSPGQEVEVQASGDLKTWTTLDTTTLVSTVWEVADPTATGLTRSFYRVGLVE